MRRFAWVCLAWALASLAACESGGQDHELGLCSAVCRCMTALPGQQQACVDACLSEPEVSLVTDACVECVFANASSCTGMMSCFVNNGPCEIDEPIPVPDDPFLQEEVSR